MLQFDGVETTLDATPERVSLARTLAIGIAGGLAPFVLGALAASSRRQVILVGPEKLVDRLGHFPLPVEVIPMAAAQVARQVRALGGEPVLRAGVVTDNGRLIVDVRGLSIADPAAMEREINQWPGVVSVGIFARNKASVCLLFAVLVLASIATACSARLGQVMISELIRTAPTPSLGATPSIDLRL